MKNSTEISFEGDHVLVRADGDKDAAYIAKLWADIVKVCEESQCFRVLGIANTTSHVEVYEAYAQAEKFRDLGIDQRYRLAWVELNKDNQALLDFVDNVLSNRGLPGKIFDTEEEARSWLFSDE